MTLVKLALMSKSKTPEKCWKCDKEKGILYHMWWQCDLAEKYWNKIYEILKIYNIPILKSPELILLGLDLERIPQMD